MGLKFKNALIAFSLLLLFTVFTSCQKDHDLVSSYVIKTPLLKAEVPEANETHDYVNRDTKTNAKPSEGLK